MVARFARERPVKGDLREGIMRSITLHAFFIALLLAVHPAVADGPSYTEVIQNDLNKRTKLVGTFDLYDDSTRKVLNLRMLSIENGLLQQKGDEAVVPVKFRDIATGSIVTLEAKIVKKAGQSVVNEWVIAKIEAPEEKVKKKENYTDEEIRQVMTDYVTQQSKFTENFQLFDPDKQIMRRLELVELSKEIRHFGILSLAEATFKDLESAETLIVDFRVKNKDGVLEVESFKIKKVMKAN